MQRKKEIKKERERERERERSGWSERAYTNLAGRGTCSAHSLPFFVELNAVMAVISMGYNVVLLHHYTVPTIHVQKQLIWSSGCSVHCSMTNARAQLHHTHLLSTVRL
jgi:hypothetical protein